MWPIKMKETYCEYGKTPPEITDIKAAEGYAIKALEWLQHVEETVR